MVKVVSLSNEAYEKLKSMKFEKSFSEVIKDLIENKRKEKKDIMEFAGIWESDKWDEIKKQIYKDRKKFKLRDFKW